MYSKKRDRTLLKASKSGCHSRSISKMERPCSKSLRIFWLPRITSMGGLSGNVLVGRIDPAKILGIKFEDRRRKGPEMPDTDETPPYS